MAFRALRSLPLTRYPLLLVPSPRFLSVDPLQRVQTPLESSTSLSERRVLDELSDLLSVDPKPPTPRSLIGNQAQAQESETTYGIRDRLLSPDEKLRGVFLQKLRGRSALHSALSATGVHPTAEIFPDVLNRGNLGGEAMVSFLEWAEQQPEFPKRVETYNLLLRALGRRKFFGFIDGILTRMKNDGIKPSSETIEILIDSFVSARQVFKAVRLFKNLEEIGSECNTESLNIIIRSLCRRSHVRVANSLLNTVKGTIVFDGMTYNEIIGGWAKFGKVDKVESVWAAMIDDGLSPDSQTFSHLIEALGRVGQIDDAINVFDGMEEKGCHRDTVTYNAMISNFVSAGDLEECLKYYKRMCEDNCSPDVDTYDKLISAFLKVRRVADALELFDEMLGRGIVPSTGMITSLIEPLCSFGPPHAAMVIYKKVRKAGCGLSLKAYKLMLMRLSRLGKSGMLLKVWEEMQDNGHNSDREVYDCIVNGLCNIGQVDNAVLVVEESLQKGFCIGKVVYSKLNNKLLEMNKIETAYKLSLKVKNARTIANSRSFWRSRGWHF